MTGTSRSATDSHEGGGLRERLHDKDALIGTFVKTTSHQIVEVLGGAALDFVVLDAEHAPFGRESLDVCCLAARYAGVPALVRTATADPDGILQALDLGATGVVVPHVDTPAIALAAVKASRYWEHQGARGFSNSPRAGKYGQLSLASHISASDKSTAVVVQIESAAAVDAVHDIASVEGIDGLFIGRADLAVSYKVGDILDAKVQAAVERVCQAGRDKDVAVGIFLPDAAEVDRFREMGVNFFVIGSDQSLLRQAAMKMAYHAKHIA